MKNRRDKTWLVIWIIIFFVFLIAILSGCNFTTTGNGSSAQADNFGANAPTQDPPPIGPPPGLSQNPPAIPMILSAVASADKVDLKWSDDSPFEEGFIIKRDGAEVAHTDRNVSVWTDTNISPEKTYCYAIIAYNKEWITNPSSEKCVTIPAPPPTQDPPVIDPSPTPIVDDSPKLLVSPTGFGECDSMVDWILFDDKPYVIWWISDELCIGPQKAYLSVFSSNNANADEISRVELSLVKSPLSIAISDGTIYVGGGNGFRGLLVALDLNLLLKWEVILNQLGPDSQSAMLIRDVAVTKDSIFVTGDTMSNESFIDMIVIRFDLDGKYIWSEQWGTSCLDWGEEVVPTSNGIDVYTKAGQLCSIMSPDIPPPSVSGDIILHYDY